MDEGLGFNNVSLEFQNKFFGGGLR